MSGVLNLGGQFLSLHTFEAKLPERVESDGRQLRRGDLCDLHRTSSKNSWVEKHGN
jgi:hypothetical protein